MRFLHLLITAAVLAIAGADQTAFARGYAEHMPEGVAAMIGATLLFILPVDWRERRFTLTWDDAVKIDWGITLLYGGGLALGEMTFATGLAQAIGEGMTAWLPSHSPLALTVLFTAAAIVLTDSGGLQEEACSLRVPCVTLRDNTERPESVDVGANVLAGADPEVIVASAVAMRSKPRDWPNPFGDGTSGLQIVDILRERLG